MIIKNKIEPLSCETSIALGYFDGIHKGHKEVILKALEQSKKHNLISTVFTFLQNPLLTLTNKNVENIITNEAKRNILQNMGVQLLYDILFSEVYNMSSEQFVSDILFKKLNAKYVCCGFNYSFGKGGKFGVKELKELCDNYNINVIVVPAVVENNMPISSTRIRDLIKNGDIKTANKLLGRNFSFKLPVIKGNKLGRTIGFPTINQSFKENFILPKFGVYVSIVNFDNYTTLGVTNIGLKPTVGSSYPLSETWLPYYHGDDLYGKDIEIKLIDYIRPEIKFENLDKLRNQIMEDSITAKNIYSKL